MDTSTTDSNQKPFVVLYRWRVRPGFEDQFVQGWSGVSRAYKRDRGALGARLHLGADGLWYSYAVWPSAQKREEAFAAGSPNPAASALVKEATVECLPEIILDLVVDLLASENDT